MYVPLTAFHNPGLFRPTDAQIKHFFERQGRMLAGATFTTVDYQLCRGIEAASQTMFVDPDYRKAVQAVARLVMKP